MTPRSPYCVASRIFATFFCSLSIPILVKVSYMLLTITSALVRQMKLGAEKRLTEAIETGEVIRIIYHAGSRPGTSREIAPIAVNGT